MPIFLLALSGVVLFGIVRALVFSQRAPESVWDGPDPDRMDRRPPRDPRIGAA